VGMKNSRSFKGVGSPKLSYYKIKNDEIKFCLLELCKQPHSIIELERITKLSRGSIKHHLNILEDRDLITRTYLKNIRGSPTQIKTNIEKIQKEEKKLSKENSNIKKILEKMKNVDIEFPLGNEEIEDEI
jgi:predicted transcriptional regulator